MAVIRPPRARAGKVANEAATYSVRIPTDVERRIRRCRASVRAAIQKNLGEIASSASAQRRLAKTPDQKEPPLRFYVYEGFRIAYQLDPEARRVVVLDLELLPAE